MRPHSTVLYGHSVAAPEMSPDIGPERGDRLDPVALDGIIRKRNGSVGITLDDGYADNLNVALPILETYGVPVTVFVTTGFVARSYAPMERAVGLAARSGLLTDKLLERLAIPASSSSAPECRYRTTRWQLRKMKRDRRDECVRVLMDECGVTADRLLEDFLTPEQVAMLDAHPLVTIGAHGVSHTNLCYTDDRELKAELKDSRAALAEWVGRTVTEMAYPYGASDRRVRRAAAEAGYCRAYGTEPGRLRRCLPLWSRMALPRYALGAAVAGNGHRG